MYEQVFQSAFTDFTSVNILPLNMSKQTIEYQKVEEIL